MRGVATSKTSAPTVDVWLIALRSAVPHLRELGGALSADELRRASRFCFVRDRIRFLSGRAVLRAILAARLEIEAPDVCFRYGRWEKPEVSTPNGLPVHFNVSHGGGYSVVALTSIAEVGVDIEGVRQIRNADAVAQMVCPEHECVSIAALSPAQREPALMVAWTRREAVLKGLGCGLHRSPREVVLSSRRRAESVDVIGLPADTDVPEAWSIRSLELPDGHVGTVAVRDHRWMLRQHLWPDGSWLASRDRAYGSRHTPNHAGRPCKRT